MYIDVAQEIMMDFKKEIKLSNKLIDSPSLTKCQSL